MKDAKGAKLAKVLLTFTEIDTLQNGLQDREKILNSRLIEYEKEAGSAFLIKLVEDKLTYLRNANDKLAVARKDLLD